MTGFSLLLLLLLTDAPRLALAESRKIRVKTDSRWFDISITRQGGGCRWRVKTRGRGSGSVMEMEVESGEIDGKFLSISLV